MLALITLSSLTAVDAHADAVSDRVVLTTGPSTCGSNASGFKRVKYLPDGTSTTDTAEFQVPAGSYLEITNIEYVLPYSTLWARSYVQTLNINMNPRTSAFGSNIVSIRYNNRAVYAGDEYEGYVGVGELVSPGAQTHVIAYPVGPLMGSAARLCVNTANNFWVYGGSVKIRGRLIPNGEMITSPGAGTASQ